MIARGHGVCPRAAGISGQDGFDTHVRTNVACLSSPSTRLSTRLSLSESTNLLYANSCDCMEHCITARASSLVTLALEVRRGDHLQPIKKNLATSFCCVRFFE